MSRGKEIPIILACALVFSLFTVYVQATKLGLKKIEAMQLERHMAVLEGNAPDPWQYRLFSEYVAEGFLWIAKSLSLPRHIGVAFVAFRLVQNVLIFALVYLYYRKLGLNLYAVLTGLSLLAYSMTYSLYDSDLQFNTYFDILFYVLAAWLILRAKYHWLLPLTLVAALNRETSGLIPVMFIAHQLDFKPKPSLPRKAVWLGGIALAIYILTIVGVRLAYGPREVFWPYGHRWGVDLLWFNVSRVETWLFMFGTLSILPLVSLICAKRWPEALQRLGAGIVPAWFIIHLFLSNTQWAESRYFLVPQVTVFIPGALFGVVQGKHAEDL